MHAPTDPDLRSIGLIRSADEKGVDLRSADGSVIVQVRTRLGGLRDFRAAVAQLALWVRPPVEKAVLVVQDWRVSDEGIVAAWRELQGILAPRVAKRLQLVAPSPRGLVALPDDNFARTLARSMERAPAARTLKRDRSFDVLRVLLARWLQKLGPVAIKDLQAITGLSHPTVLKSIRELGAHIDRRSDRSVDLESFPIDAWHRVVALASRVRETQAFIDGSGRAANPQGLLERLFRMKLRPGQVAVGGVPGARHWYRGLDLDGLPRIDLTVHAPNGPMDTEFVARLDPALAPAPHSSPPLLVLHALPRAQHLFTPSGKGLLPWADPVECLLDLQELRLPDQADELVRHLRAAK